MNPRLDTAKTATTTKTATTAHPEAPMRSARLALLTFLLALPVAPALALPCAGFTDVDDTSPFCPNVEWLRNRGITLGCAANLYCPTDAVSRLAMAVFMNRLGTALTPAQYAVDVATGAVDLDGARRGLPERRRDRRRVSAPGAGRPRVRRATRRRR